MISKMFIAAQGSFPASMLLLGRRPARMRPAPLARTSVLPRQNLGAGGIQFRRAFQSFQRNPWGACAPRNRPHHNRSHDIKDIHSCSRFLSYFYAVVGPSSGAYAPPRLRRVRAFCRRQNLGAGGIHFRRAFQSFQRNPWGACAPRDRPHHNGPHDIKDVHSCSRFLSLLPCCRWAVVGRGASCRRCSFYVDFLALSRGNGASGMPRPTAHRFGLPDNQAGSPAHPRWRASHERPEKGPGSGGLLLLCPGPGN